MEESTVIDIYADDGSWLESVLLSAGERYVIRTAQSATQGEGSALRLVANKPIGAVQSADGDGRDQTAFFPTELLGMQFGIPVDTQYVAVTCSKPQTRITLYIPEQAPQTRVV